jgi:hypothetical protein
MATASEIADLITQGMQGPMGADDSGWHLGLILSWDSATGLNSVLVNNATLTNLKALAPSIGTEYSRGQNVLIVRKQTQYFILGPVQAPGNVGSTPAKQVDAVGGTMSPAAGANVWRDLDGGASLSPSFTVKLAPFQRCLFMWGSDTVRTWGCKLESSLVVASPGGNNGLANPGATAGQSWTVENQISVSNNIQVPGFKTFFAQAGPANSFGFLSAGVCTASIKYRVNASAGAAGAGTATCNVGTPWLVAIPF